MLVIDGLDTLATVRVNGKVVIEAANAFRSYRAELADIARIGENAIEITFHSVTKEAAKRKAAQPFPIPHSKNCPIPDGNLIRKPACDFGWDWNIALAPFGITGGIRLEPLRATRVAGLSVIQHHEPGAVTLTVDAALAGEPSQAVLSFTFGGETRQVTASGTKATAQFRITDPQLW
ncbi:MAG: glycoside hydrolase family 2 protein, partial [Pseudomonadota bacterium]